MHTVHARGLLKFEGRVASGVLKNQHLSRQGKVQLNRYGYSHSVHGIIGNRGLTNSTGNPLYASRS